MMKSKKIITPLILGLLIVSSNLFGTEPRFKVYPNDGAPTVTDGVTSLTWQQSSTIEAPLSWLKALAHCESSEYAGFTDWRLPQIPELLSIVDEKKTQAPAINTSYFIDFNPASGYWTSTTHRKTPSSAYVVFFNEQNVTSGRGGVGALTKDANAQALCVRSSN